MVHCLRYSRQPFLPNPNNDERRLVEEGNVIKYGVAKNTFLSLIVEEGYAKEDFKDFDVPYQGYCTEAKFDGKDKKKKPKGGKPNIED